MINLDNFDKYDDKSFMRFSSPAIVEKDLQILSGIVEGIVCDKKINEQELQGLNDWLLKTGARHKKEPYKGIVERITLALEDYLLSEEEKDDILWLCKQFIEKNDYYDLITGGIQKLSGVVHGIIIDKEINQEELAFLYNWLEDNSRLKNTWPYDELYSLVLTILHDKVITAEEHKLLLEFCDAVIHGHSSNDKSSNLAQTLNMGFCQVDPEISVTDKLFCLTGISKKPRKEIAAMIELYGGYITDTMSGKVNYLVVCDEKNSCWAFCCYGRKVEKAVSLRKEGKPLQIIHEFDLFDAIEDLKSTLN